MSAILEARDRHAEAFPARTAISDSRQSLCYAELAGRVLAFADQLRKHDCRVVGLLADNGAAWVVADLAAQRADLTLVPLPPYFTESQLAHVLATSGMDTLLVEDANTARRLAGRDFESLGVDLEGLVMLKNQAAERAPARSGPAPAKVTFTSGSTGQPKGVRLGTQTISDVALRLHEVTADLGIERHLCVMPLATLLENVAGVYVPLMQGATVHVPSLGSLGLYGSSRIDADRLRQTVETTGAESLILQPEILRALTESYRSAERENRDLKFVAVGGAKVSDDDLEDAAAVGLPAYQGYGLSECGSVVALNRPGDSRRGSVGRPLPGVAVTISETGEILVGNQTMLGYVGDRAPAGVIHTGDLGRLDDDGFLYVTGRAKNMFITSFGRNVSPEWPEAELLHEAEIAHACVFGEGRPANIAILVPADPKIPVGVLRNAIRRANDRLPDYARIAEWIVAANGFSVANGLLTATGKPRREAVAFRFLLGDDATSSTQAASIKSSLPNNHCERTLNETL